MLLEELKGVFQRALAASLSMRKAQIAFGGLTLCGLLDICMHGTALQSSAWTRQSLGFVTVLLTIGLLMPLGVILVRAYYNEVKGQAVDFWAVTKESADILLGTSYFSVPPVLAYVVLWMGLGIFQLIASIPALGAVLATLLAFVPFFLYLGALALCLAAVAGLFFIIPSVALGGAGQWKAVQEAWKRLERDPFTQVGLFALAVLPVAGCLALLLVAAKMTLTMAVWTSSNPIFSLAHGFFVMIPFMALLAPAVTFFFNFATEAFVLAERESKKEANQVSS